MMILQDSNPRYVEIEARGKLTRKDYDQVVPRLERMMADRGKLRVLIKLDDFDGWTPQALLDDLRFDIRHRKDFEQTAVVGESGWQKFGTQLAAPFFSGEVRFFEDTEAARRWLS